MTQEKLGTLVGCKRANIANIERGLIFPSFIVLKKLKKVLDLQVDEALESVESK